MTNLERILHLREAALDLIAEPKRTGKQIVILGALRSSLHRMREFMLDYVLEAHEDERLDLVVQVNRMRDLFELPTDWDLEHGDREAIIAEHRKRGRHDG